MGQGNNHFVDARDWSMPRRVFIAGVVCLYTFVVYTASAIYVIGVHDVMADFSIGEQEALLGLSVYVLAYGLGPLLWAPLSELNFIGRNPIYALTFIAFVGFSVLSATIRNWPGYLVARFFQAFFGSPCLAIGGASMHDLFSETSVPYSLAVWIAAAYCGPALGPLIAGYLVPEKGWRWGMWEIVWLAGPTCLLILLLPETHGPTRRARRMKVMGNPEQKGQAPHQTWSRIKTILWTLGDAIVKPVQILPMGLASFGWTSNGTIHWIVSLIGVTLYAMGTFIVLQCLSVYLPRIYPDYSASLFAANDFCRSSLAAAAVHVGIPLYENLGIGKGVSVLAGLSVFGIAGIWFIYWKAANLTFQIESPTVAFSASVISINSFSSANLQFETHITIDLNRTRMNRHYQLEASLSGASSIADMNELLLRGGANTPASSDSSKHCAEVVEDSKETEAGSNVFGTAELLEMILLEIDDVRTVLLSQRVNKTFKATVQGSKQLSNKLWLKANERGDTNPDDSCEITAEGGLFCAETPHCEFNPLFNQLISSSRTRYFRQSMTHLGAPRITILRSILEDRRSYSWHNMLLVRSEGAEFQLEARLLLHGHVKHLVLSCQPGLTMKDLLSKLRQGISEREPLWEESEERNRYRIEYGFEFGEVRTDRFEYDSDDDGLV
ncbi:Multidrug resistance protein 1 [Pseudocercospora fuligena]|uniref:Multidrug resistance protein 1 n=1 Tax=Pseudocercospora fuligena TaxID=685502 RepID=A0A8H6VJH8_9PEZI|nr:Multidrug resistance protein 1 [Pseudocercospora fuligena]